MHESHSCCTQPLSNYQTLKVHSYCEYSASGVVFHKDAVRRVEHRSGRSVLHCEDGTSVAANLVLDATGHARKLVEFDRPFKPGYQVSNPFQAYSEVHKLPLRLL